MSKPLGNAPSVSQTGTGEKVIYAGPGKRVTVLIDALNGNTVNIIGYTMTEAQATERSLTRRKHILEEAISVPYAKSTTGGMAEVGIEVTAGGGQTIADFMLSSLATSG